MQVHTRNKKRKIFLRDVYPNQTYHIPKNPYELEYRIENSKEQKIKEYDFFISHSSKERCIETGEFIVEPLKTDWFVDSDYENISLKLQA